MYKVRRQRRQPVIYPRIFIYAVPEDRVAEVLRLYGDGTITKYKIYAILKILRISMPEVFTRASENKQVWRLVFDGHKPLVLLLDGNEPATLEAGDHIKINNEWYVLQNSSEYIPDGLAYKRIISNAK